MLQLLLVTALLFTPPVDTIVLRGGYQIAIAGEVSVENDRALFRAADGTLYSLPIEEIDVDATERLAAEKSNPRAEPKPVKKLRKSDDELDRILRALEGRSVANPPPRVLSPLPPEMPERERPKQDEWKWRNAARHYLENLTRAREELALLVEREEELEDRILGFISAGYEEQQFSYDTHRLVRTREAIPRAELEVTRAERALTQFREDALRQGALPGWLR